MSIISVQIDNYKQRKQLMAIDQKIEEQMLENDELLRIVGNSDESDYIEQIAREKLGYAAPGERVFVDVAGTGGGADAGTAEDKGETNGE
ncbi:MAG: septum formation initiator family protein [Ruminococcaceae bacterium]|nr:septum formation initiator family protein [Oscillospiraceae bacterium]